MIWLTISLVLFFVGLVMVVWFWRHRSDQTSSSSGGWLNSNIEFNLPGKLVSSVMQMPGLQTKIVFNGQEFSSLEDMPPDIRKAYDQVMSGMLVDANRNSIPDIIEGGSVFTGIRTLTPDDPAEKLKKLNEMRDSGLITTQEYESKRAEILSRM